MNKPKIGIVVGSVREGRFADKVLAWLLKIVAARQDLEFIVLDLKDYALPFFNERRSPASGADAQNEVAQRWRAQLAPLDGFIFLTAEYNHSPTAVLVNALDWAYSEWNRKPVAFVGYGSMGASRAIEQLRGQIAELQMVSIRYTTLVGGGDMKAIWNGSQTIDDFVHLVPSTERMLDDLNWWASVLKAARAATSA